MIQWKKNQCKIRLCLTPYLQGICTINIYCDDINIVCDNTNTGYIISISNKKRYPLSFWVHIMNITNTFKLEAYINDIQLFYYDNCKFANFSRLNPKFNGVVTFTFPTY